MPIFFKDIAGPELKPMVFVDGENLSIRYGKMLESEAYEKFDHIEYENDIFLWSNKLKKICHNGGVIRTYYYTSVTGDTPYISQIEDKLKAIGIEAPRVFKKQKSRGSKRVDITLATDMLMHASRANMNLAVLIAGDEDYVPLVEAVKLEGCRVFVWFIDNGISPSLRKAADRYVDIGEVLFKEQPPPEWW